MWNDYIFYYLYGQVYDPENGVYQLIEDALIEDKQPEEKIENAKHVKVLK